MSAISIDHPRITLPWLNDCLAKVRGESRITGHVVEDVGAGSGFAGTVLRVTLTYDPACDAPASIIVKLPVKEGDILDLLKAQDLLLRESHFYRELAPRLGIRTPRIYNVEIDGEDFVIAMEDLGDIKPEDPLKTVDVQDAKYALAAIAELHAVFWNHPDVDAAWLKPISPSSPEIRQQLDDGVTKTIALMETAGVDVEYALSCARTLKKALPRFPDEFPMLKPITVIHGDYHRNNLHIEGGTVTVYDWQAIMKGRPATDIANFLLTGLEADQLNASRHELLQAYHEALRANGIKDFSMKQLTRAFSQASTDTVMKMLVVIGTIDLDVEGGDDMLKVILVRIDAHARSVGARWKLRLMPVIFLILRIISFFSRKRGAG